MKKLLYILGGLLVVLLVGFVIVLFSLGSIVTAGVNKVGPRLTQSEVELKSAKISPFSGAGTLNELTVGNPTGWQTERAFFLKEITIEIEPRSLKSDHIVVTRILIDQPEITYETTITNSNLQDILRNIQQAAGGTGAPGQPPPPEKEEGEPVKIEIKSFRLQNGVITIAGAGTSTTVPMPEIVLNNVGTQEGGLTAEQIAMVLMKEVTNKAIQAAAQSAAKRGLFDKAGEGLRGLLEKKK